MRAFACPQCGQKLQAKDELVGKKVRCPKCGQAAAVPIPPEMTAPAGLPRPAPAAAPEATVGAAPSNGQADDDFAFLAPPQGPGELGRLGGYRVLKVLGKGGMGVVFLAEDIHLKRPVALKVIKPGSGSADAKQRFLREAQATAQLKHDHVVTIHQVGEERGAPFLAMEFLKGEPLDQRLQREGRLSIPEALRIARETAEGLAAAHEAGLIHRDIKPANLWLEAPKGRVKILDFGLARAAGDDVQLTQAGTILGTPAYMAPEQAQGEQVDPHCDLYSLGSVLYLMCAGHTPFQGKSTMALLTALALESPRPLAEINPAVPPALADLVTRLLAKKPEDRPPSAAAVVQAIEAIEHAQAAQGETLMRPSPARRAKAGGPRRRWPLALVAAVLLLLGGAAVFWFTRPRGDEQSKGPPAPTASSAPRPSGPPDQPDPIPAGQPLSPLALVTNPARVPGVQSWTIETVAPRDNVRTAAYSPDGRRLATFGDDGTVRIWDLDTGRLFRALVGHAKGTYHGQHVLHQLAWSADGKRLASGSADGTARLWEVESGRALRVLNANAGVVGAVAWSVDGQTVATGTPDGKVRLWNTTTGELLNVLTGHTGPIADLAWSPDGKVLASAEGGSPGRLDNTIRLWDSAGKSLHVFQHDLQGDGGNCLAWSPDSKTLAFSRSGGPAVWLWDAATGKNQRKISPPAAGRNFVSIFWLPGGKELAVSGSGKGQALWIHDPETGGLLRTVEPKDKAGQFFSSAWSPDGKTFASFKGATVWIIDAHTGDLRLTLPNTQTNVGGVRPAWSPDGNFLAWASFNYRLGLWDVRSGRCLRVVPVGVGTIAGTWSPDGRRLAATHYGQNPTLWETASGKSLGTFTGAPHGSSGKPVLAWSPDGQRLATGTSSGKTVKLWDTENRKLVQDLGWPEDGISALAWSPDGKALAAGGVGPNPKVRLWDAGSGKLRHTLAGHIDSVDCLAWSPDGKYLASGSHHHENTVRVWDTSLGKELHALKGHSGDVLDLTWLPDGQTLVSRDDQQVMYWQAVAGKHLRTVPAPGREGTFSPGGRLVASAAFPGALLIWEADSGRPRGQLVPLTDGLGIGVSAAGHYRGEPGTRIVYVVQTEQGQETLTPAEFAQKYGWKNDPEQVRLSGK